MKITMKRVETTHDRAKKCCQFAPRATKLTPQQAVKALNGGRPKKLKEKMDAWKDACITVTTDFDHTSKLMKELTELDNVLKAKAAELTCQLHQPQQAKTQMDQNPQCQGQQQPTEQCIQKCTIFQ